MLRAATIAAPAATARPPAAATAATPTVTAITTTITTMDTATRPPTLVTEDLPAVADTEVVVEGMVSAAASAAASAVASAIFLASPSVTPAVTDTVTEGTSPSPGGSGIPAASASTEASDSVSTAASGEAASEAEDSAVVDLVVADMEVAAMEEVAMEEVAMEEVAMEVAQEDTVVSSATIDVIICPAGCSGIFQFDQTGLCFFQVADIKLAEFLSQHLCKVLLDGWSIFRVYTLVSIVPTFPSLLLFSATCYAIHRYNFPTLSRSACFIPAFLCVRSLPAQVVL
ncbi:hypothetical protein RvY_03709-1 [Ramazzottius varieornatus]|uniref:Uncharacterized protein n=1 Tax=Ramazzottius varieornatus TaxID=947166 RepID=A0A1D1UUP3_RAMVA|nr:hypothetical protein RvY_03709-1 [Ramazzottius varieornatus]